LAAAEWGELGDVVGGGGSELLGHGVLGNGSRDWECGESGGWCVRSDWECGESGGWCVRSDRGNCVDAGGKGVGRRLQSWALAAVGMVLLDGVITRADECRGAT
jgi:hypothetical protein